MDILVYIIIILLIGSIYINVNLLNKFEQMEVMAEYSVDELLRNEKFLTDLKTKNINPKSTFTFLKNSFLLINEKNQHFTKFSYHLYIYILTA